MEAFSQWEGQLLVFLQEHVRSEALNGPLTAITSLGNAGIFWIVLTLILLFFRKTRRVGFASMFGLLISLVVVNFIIKNWVARVRPYDAIEALHYLVGPEKDFSFPSGHSSASFASAWAIFRMKTKPRWPAALAVALAALIALTRLYVGVHYPTDVLAGVIIGVAAGAIGAWGAKKLRAPFLEN